MAAANPFDPTQQGAQAAPTDPNQTGAPGTKTAQAAPAAGAAPAVAPTPGIGTNTGGANVAPQAGAPAGAQAPGLISAAMTAGTTQNATSTGYTPTTVASELGGVIDQNSPLMQKAQSDALQTANGRGLLNSSMAAGAGTAALLDKALQIATPDAAAKNQAAAFTANAGNTTSLANAQAGNAAISQDAAAKLQAATTNYQGSLQTAMQNASEADKVTLQNLDSQVRTNLAQIQAQYQTQMQTSQSSASMYAQTMNTIGQIMQDPNLDAGAKQNLINQAMDTFKGGLNLQMGISNIPGVASLISNLGSGPGGVPPAAGGAAPVDNRRTTQPVGAPGAQVDTGSFDQTGGQPIGGGG